MEKIIDLASKVIEGYKLNLNEAIELWSEGAKDHYQFFYAASKINRYFHKERVDLCGIISVKKGGCPEDCKFCAQSIHHNSGYKRVSYLKEEEILKKASLAKKNKIKHLGLVVSGRRLKEEEFLKICEIVKEIKLKEGLDVCASLGEIDRNRAEKLKEIGIFRYNHNLETSSNFFPKICTTHSFSQRLETIKNLKEVGINLCVGGIMGMGESLSDRISLALTLRDLEVDIIPINFLNPIKGTPFSSYRLISPLEALKIISLYRFLLPDKIIKVCGGREVVLRDLQAFLFYVGGNGMILGDYLTTKGRSLDDDLIMIKDLGLKL
jgi:biotin synthase